MSAELLRALAAAIHEEADERRERAIKARAYKAIMGSEADEWAVSFATAYQTLRGIASACSKVADQLDQPKPEKPLKATPNPGRAAGGYARAASMSPEQRRELARKAANARWGNRTCVTVREQ